MLSPCPVICVRRQNESEVKLNRAQCRNCRKALQSIKVDHTSAFHRECSWATALNVPSSCPCWGLCLGESSRSKDLTADGSKCILMPCLVSSVPYCHAVKLYCKVEYLRVAFYNKNTQENQ